MGRQGPFFLTEPLNNRGWEWRCYEIRSGSSYRSQNHVRVHFGLGKAARIDSLEIR